MPGWGLLFEEREHLLQMIHLSLREFLLDSDRSGSYAADVRRGHSLLAQSCLQVLLERTTGPTLAYALRHGHVHLSEVLVASSADSVGVIRQWFSSFLQPRFRDVHSILDEAQPQDQNVSVHQPKPRSQSKQEQASFSCDATDEFESESQAGSEPEPELEPESEPDPEPKLEPQKRVNPPQSHTLSSWQARRSVVEWLERQAAYGRSKVLVPELLSLEERLLKWSEDNPSEWTRALWQLVQHLRWGIGTFWAPHYEINPNTARVMFANNMCVNSPMYHSEVDRRLSTQNMCLPGRVGISPTIHQLVGHGDYVTSVQFSPDGLKLASGSFDKTLRIWDAVTGECEQTLEGHGRAVESVQFSPDGLKLASGSWDKTLRIWDAVTGECEQTLEGHGREVTSGNHTQLVTVLPTTPS